jgi:hypothetical protein
MRAIFKHIFLATSLCGIPALTLPVATVHAQDYCGFKDQKGFRVHCGYSTVTRCEKSIGGKDAICMPDPTFAARKRQRATG